MDLCSSPFCLRQTTRLLHLVVDNGKLTLNLNDFEFTDKGLLSTEDKRSCGCFELKSVFHEEELHRETKSIKANVMKGKFSISGFPSLSNILDTNREPGFFLEAEDNEAVFSNLTQEIANLANIEVFRQDKIDRKNYTLHELTFQVNISKMEEKYSGVVHSVVPLSEIILHVLPDDNIDTSIKAKGLEKDFILQYTRVVMKANVLKVNTVHATNSRGEFVIFQKDPSGNGFSGEPRNLDTTSLLVSTDIKCRIPQLCGSFWLPRTIQRISRTSKDEIKLSIYHMTKQSILTRLILKPFINLDKLYALLEDFLEISISTRGNRINSTLDVDFLIPLVTVPGVVKKFLAQQVKKFNGSNGMIELLLVLFKALGKDLINITTS